jgi:hypothetical protein
MGKMLQQAQKMQQKLQEEIAAIRAEGTAGGGVVKAVVDGQKGLLSLEIAPEVVEEPDAAMIADLVLAAVHDAQRKADEEAQQKVGALSGAMGLPPGLGF